MNNKLKIILATILLTHNGICQTNYKFVIIPSNTTVKALLTNATMPYATYINITNTVTNAAILLLTNSYPTQILSNNATAYNIYPDITNAINSVSASKINATNTSIVINSTTNSLTTNQSAISYYIDRTSNKRNCIIAAPTNDIGNADFLTTGASLSMTTKNIASTNNLNLTFNNGFVNGSKSDYVGTCRTNITWTSLTPSTVNYLFLQYNPNTKFVSTGFSTLQELRQLATPAGPSVGQIWYPYNNSQAPKYWNGSAWVITNIVFIGEAITSGSGITSSYSYPLANVRPRYYLHKNTTLQTLTTSGTYYPITWSTIVENTGYFYLSTSDYYTITYRGPKNKLKFYIQISFDALTDGCLTQVRLFKNGTGTTTPDNRLVHVWRRTGAVGVFTSIVEYTDLSVSSGDYYFVDAAQFSGTSKDVSGTIKYTYLQITGVE